MQDLVFVKYNQALKARYNSKDEIDPISLDCIDDSNEWLIGKMGGDQDDAENEFVFGDDDLTWGEVARAFGAEEPRKYTRRICCRQSALKPSSSKGKVVVQEIEEEEADTEESKEEIEDYHSSDRDDNSDDDEMNVVDEDDIDADDLS
ncbi:hypothetical protein SLEP1_g26250 [Rubroshorea leprosula]|uniref:Uncharacterized protein n=1 Tax=Rubroshorea leprosula TaxID=152421 RepID=A0AAV5JX40_9ROSI|nr:hypothetical protein SLEP1_g26250 [Rubroshorea leprosula]